MTATLISIDSWDANRRADLGVENRFLPAATPGSVRRAAHRARVHDSPGSGLRSGGGLFLLNRQRHWIHGFDDDVRERLRLEQPAVMGPLGKLARLSLANDRRPGIPPVRSWGPQSYFPLLVRNTARPPAGSLAVASVAPAVAGCCRSATGRTLDANMPGSEYPHR